MQGTASPATERVKASLQLVLGFSWTLDEALTRASFVSFSSLSKKWGQIKNT